MITLHYWTKDREMTSLQNGDRIVYRPKHHELAFERLGHKLERKDGQNRFCIPVDSYTHLLRVIFFVSELTGKKIEQIEPNRSESEEALRANHTFTFVITDDA